MEQRPVSRSIGTRAVGVRDVAARAGVSAATVSRVLNGLPTVKARHREAVERAMTELGYRPNRLASNLRRRKVDMIGVLVSDIENPHFGTVVRAIEDAAYRRGFTIILCDTYEDPAKQALYLDILAGERVQGVIMTPSDPIGPEITHLLDLGIPVVALDRSVRDSRADTVIGGNLAAAQLATNHLIRQGHRRIGCISGPPATDPGADRLAGYERSMQEHDLEPISSCGWFKLQEGRAAASEILLNHPDLTALVVSNNLMAIGVLQVLRERGIRVPDDIALVVFDDPFWTALNQPPLTSIRQPIREMAEASLGLLAERLAGREEPSHLVFDYELIVRDSSVRGPRESIADQSSASLAPLGAADLSDRIA